MTTFLVPAAARACSTAAATPSVTNWNLDASRDLGGRLVSDDEAHRCTSLVLVVPVADLVVPPVRPVHDVEQSPPHHHRASGQEAACQHCIVDR